MVKHHVLSTVLFELARQDHGGCSQEERTRYRPMPCRTEAVDGAHGQEDGLGRGTDLFANSDRPVDNLQSVRGRLHDYL